MQNFEAENDWVILFFFSWALIDFALFLLDIREMGWEKKWQIQDWNKITFPVNLRKLSLQHQNIIYNH